MKLKLASLVLVLLIAATCFAQGRRQHTSDSKATPYTPLVVATVHLTKQSDPIPPTAIFTPTQSGLFRVSMYMTQTAPQASGLWALHIAWTDDAGVERTYQPMILLQADAHSPSAWGSYDGAPGSVVVIQAVAGQVIEYQVSGEHPTNGAFSLYMVVEQLE
jgi:hypothetical protein